MESFKLKTFQTWSLHTFSCNEITSESNFWRIWNKYLIGQYVEFFKITFLLSIYLFANLLYQCKYKIAIKLPKIPNIYPLLRLTEKNVRNSREFSFIVCICSSNWILDMAKYILRNLNVIYSVKLRVYSKL